MRPDIEGMDAFRKCFEGSLSVSDTDDLFAYVKELEYAATEVSNMFPAEMCEDVGGKWGFTKIAAAKIDHLRDLLRVMGK